MTGSQRLALGAVGGVAVLVIALAIRGLNPPSVSSVSVADVPPTSAPTESAAATSVAVAQAPSLPTPLPSLAPRPTDVAEARAASAEPTPVPPAADTGEVAYASDTVRLRSAASLDPSTTLDILSQGTPVTILEVNPNGPAFESDSTWYRVDVPSLKKQGWVWAGLLTRGSTPVTPVAAAVPATVVPITAGTVSGAEELNWFSIGNSIQDRPIRAIRIGSGPVHLAIMGAIHGGWEKNTMTLVQMAYEHFRDNPDEIPDQLSVFFIPATNPDGIAYGTNSDSAWNANGVDLNRNFASYNWSQDTFGRVGGRYGPTGTKKNGGGPSPFSEPETRAVRDFILGKGIAAVLSYHSGIVSVTAKDGGGGVGEPLAKQVAAITGYGYIGKWTEYKLTGQFMDWLDEQQVKGVEVELPDQQTLDWAKNLMAMQAAMQTLAQH